jgi:hypothetical protein
LMAPQPFQDSHSRCRAKNRQQAAHHPESKLPTGQRMTAFEKHRRGACTADLGWKWTAPSLGRRRFDPCAPPGYAAGMFDLLQFSIPPPPRPNDPPSARRWLASLVWLAALIGLGLATPAVADVVHRCPDGPLESLVHASSDAWLSTLRASTVARVRSGSQSRGGTAAWQRSMRQPIARTSWSDLQRRSGSLSRDLPGGGSAAVPRPQLPSLERMNAARKPATVMSPA